MANTFTTILGIISRLISVELKLIPFIIWDIWLHVRDIFYTFLSLLLPYKSAGQVIAQGRPGHGGMWPPYVAPQATDSRSPCPGLNTLANHGILPHNGKKLTYAQMSEAIQHAYNLSPSLGDQLTSSAYMLDQGRGYIDLHDLNALNVIQHDASFTRPDIAFCPDQGYPHADVVQHFLSHSTDGKTMSIPDMIYFSGLRRAECRANNGQFSLTYSFFHKFFGSGNCALMYGIFGGNVKDLTCWLTEERIPYNWEPKNRWRAGTTIIFAQKTSLEVEFNINEKQKLRAGDVIPNTYKKDTYYVL